MRARIVLSALLLVATSIVLSACGGGGGSTAAATEPTTPVTAAEATVGASFLPPDSGITAAAGLGSDQLSPDAASSTDLAADQSAPAS